MKKSGIWVFKKRITDNFVELRSAETVEGSGVGIDTSDGTKATIIRAAFESNFCYNPYLLSNITLNKVLLIFPDFFRFLLKIKYMRSVL